MRAADAASRASMSRAAGIDRHRLDPLMPSLYPASRWGLSAEPPALQRVLTGHTEPVYAVAFGPDGRLASVSDDGTVRLWDPGTGAEQTILAGHTSQVYAVAFSPDGQRLAFASEDRTVRLWDSTATGALSLLRLPVRTGVPLGSDLWPCDCLGASRTI